MRTFVLRRLLHTLVMLLGAATLTFFLIQVVPGDFSNTLVTYPNMTPEMIEAMRRRFGLDRPWWVQYALYLENVFLHLDFGISFSRNQPVFTVIREGLFNTLMLQAAAAFVTWGLALPLGVWAAWKHGAWMDRALSSTAYVVLAIPEFLAAMLLLMLAATTGWFPLGGMRSMDWNSFGMAGKAVDVLWHLALPALLMVSAMLVVGNLVGDLLLAVADPRIVTA